MIVFVYSVCCIVWGSTWAVIRVGLGELPPLAFAALRMSLVAALLLPIALRWRSQRRLLLQLYAIGALQFGVCVAFIFAAETHIDSGLTAVLFGTYPLFALAASRLWLPGETLRPQHVAAIALGFVGIIVMHSDTTHALTVAALFPIFAAIGAAVASIATKRVASQTPALVTLGINAQSGAAVLWALHFALEGPFTVTARGAAAVAYLAVLGSIVAYGCLLWLLPRIPIALISFMTFVEALFGVLVGMALLGEHPAPRVIAGAGVILASIAVAIAPGDGAGALLRRAIRRR